MIKTHNSYKKEAGDYLGIIFPGALVAAIIESTHFYSLAR